MFKVNNKDSKTTPTPILKLNLALSQERKELLRWNKKHSSSFLNGFNLPEIVSNLKIRL